MSYKIEKYSKIVYRVYEDDILVYFISALANGKWVLNDLNDVRVEGSPVFDKPKDVISWIEK